MMRRGLTVRQSRAAGWARLAGGLALPVLILAVLGTRAGAVPIVALQPVLVAGFALGLLALGLAIFSLVDIWRSGVAGAGSAIAGIVYASPVLVIIGLVAAAAIAYPRLTDLTTDTINPPPFTLDGSPLGAPDPESLALQLRAYPDIAARLYPSSLSDTYAAVRSIFAENRWILTRDIPPPAFTIDPGAETTSALFVPEDDELMKALALKSEMTQSRGGHATETRPADLAPQPGAPSGSARWPVMSSPIFLGEAFFGEMPDAAILEATAPTLVFGFPDDVVVRMIATPDGTQVDMRSASRIGEHDLGENARRIRGFFKALEVKFQPDPNAPAGTASASR